MNMHEWRQQRAAKLASPDVLVPPATPSPAPVLAIVPQAAPPQEPVEPTIAAQSVAAELQQNGTNWCDVPSAIPLALAIVPPAPGTVTPQAVKPQEQPPAPIAEPSPEPKAHQNGTEMAPFSGVIKAVSPMVEWPKEAQEAIAWLEELDVTTVPPFLISPSWPVLSPGSFFERLRRDVDQGPRGPHAQQVASDLQRVMVATQEAIASGRRPTPAQLIHGSTQPTRATIKHEWDAETDRRIVWLDTVTLPPTPFAFGSRGRVADADAFLRGLRTSITQGPDGPRARTGAIQADLALLERIVVGHKEER